VGSGLTQEVDSGNQAVRIRPPTVIRRGLGISDVKVDGETRPVVVEW